MWYNDIVKGVTSELLENVSQSTIGTTDQFNDASKQQESLKEVEVERNNSTSAVHI